MAFNVHLDDHIVMRKQQLRRSPVLRNAALVFGQGVACVAAALVGLRQVETGLLAEAPLRTLVAINAGSTIVGHFLTLGTLADSSCWTSLTFELTVEERTALCRANRVFVGVVLAVFPPVAHLRLGNALGLGARRAERTEELVVRTRDAGAVGLVRSVDTVAVPVAMVGHGDAQGIGALELADVTRREIAVLLIAVVGTVVVVVALELRIDALHAVGAPELVQLTRESRVQTLGRTVFLVASVSTVVIAVAFLLLGDADAVRRVALEIAGRTFAEITVSLIRAVNAVDYFITAVMLGKAVRLVPDVLLAGQLSWLTLGGRTSLLLVLALVTVLVEVAHPQGGDASPVQTSELTRWAAGGGDGDALCLCMKLVYVK